MAAGCGILTPQCRPGRFSGYFEFFQRFEYMRAFLWRLAWSQWNALVLVSGAFAVYRRDVLEKLGGFNGKSWVEDYEILYRLHRSSGDEGRKWTVNVIPGARGVTDAPSAPGQFLRQRSRWFGGFLATLFGNQDMVGLSRYGGMGSRLLPAKTIDTLLPIFAALAQISLIVLVCRGGFLTGFLLSILAAKLIFDLVMHLWAIRIYGRWLAVPITPRLLLQSLGASLLEPFFFQPLRYTGALLGWLAFLRNRFQWESQRLTPAPAPA
jgi:cellulose synthase/poly-beta-1,6-N-acetylglucosamine synthase-like glycosyltransferase